jgi:hypothetical protein
LEEETKTEFKRVVSWERTALLVATTAGLMPGVASAQTDVSSTRISGTVRDAGGGVVPGVTIAVKSLQEAQGGS